MLLKFQHLVLENFLSFGYAEIDLNDRGYTLVNGINRNPTDNAQSNGSGKSTMFDAMCYALTGETIRGISKNLVNIHTTGGMRVELTFQVDDVDYRIIRTKDHKEYGTTIKFYVNGEDKSGKGVRDTDKLITEYLPDLTKELIGSVIILGQGMPQRFTNNTPSGRKEVLEKLSNSDFMIEDIKARLSARKTVLGKNSRDLELKITSLQSQCDAYEKQKSQYISQLDLLVAPDLSEINALQDKLQQLKQTQEQLNVTIGEQRRKLEELTQQQATLANEQLAETSQYKSSVQEQLSEKKERVYALSAESKSLEAEIKRLKNVRDTCPTCGQKLPDVHKVDTSEREERLAAMLEELSTLNKDLQQFNVEIEEHVKAIGNKYSQQKLEIINQINELKTTLSGKGREADTLAAEIRHQELSLAALQSNYTNYEQRKADLARVIHETEEYIAKLKDEILYNITGRTEVDGRLDMVNKMLTIATRDFRGFLLTNVIEYINNRAKSYSQDIFETDKIEFSLDGNNLNVSYDDKPYENLSGGEQKKVDIIAQLSLRDMLCQFSSFSSNVLCLDEMFDALDSLGCNKVIDTIAKRLTDIETVFIVTHRSNLCLPADSTITILKDESGISRIQQ